MGTLTNWLKFINKIEVYFATKQLIRLHENSRLARSDIVHAVNRTMTAEGRNSSWKINFSHVKQTGPGCSNLTTSLVNVSVNFQR